MIPKSGNWFSGWIMRPLKCISRAKSPQAEDYYMGARRTLQPILACAALALGASAHAADSAKALPGIYENDLGTVIIKKTPAGYDVDISTEEPMRGVWACDFSGSGKLDASGALVVVYTPEAGRDTATVRLTLILKRDVLTVSETRSTDIVDFCGYRGFLQGDYRRKVKR